jgi:hypothetical protein
MYSKAILTEEEFDKLPEGSQMNYRYCPFCGCFYHRSEKCLCGKEGKHDAKK